MQLLVFSFFVSPPAPPHHRVVPVVQTLHVVFVLACSQIEAVIVTVSGHGKRDTCRSNPSNCWQSYVAVKYRDPLKGSLNYKGTYKN